MTQRCPQGNGDEQENAAELASAISHMASQSRQSAGLFPFGTQVVLVHRPGPHQGPASLTGKLQSSRHAPP